MWIPQKSRSGCPSHTTFQMEEQIFASARTTTTPIWLDSIAILRPTERFSCILTEQILWPHKLVVFSLIPLLELKEVKKE
jgi:hypothetical protein